MLFGSQIKKKKGKQKHYRMTRLIYASNSSEIPLDSSHWAKTSTMLVAIGKESESCTLAQKTNENRGHPTKPTSFGFPSLRCPVDFHGQKGASFFGWLSVKGNPSKKKGQKGATDQQVSGFPLKLSTQGNAMLLRISQREV